MSNVIAASLEAVVLNTENPWPGLVSFSEANEAYFFGREQEIADLVRRITQESLTIFFGKSGLGKSSILQAGIAPELRRSAFVPIYIRLDYADHASSLAAQVLGHIRTTLNYEGIDAPRPALTETMWEYFHARGCDWWNGQNQLVKPVLMFDQFEELLTLGQSTLSGAASVEEFLVELEDLVDNRVPSGLEKRLSAERGLGSNFDFNRTGCHIVLALREDYLADLESLHQRLRPIMRNRFRLLPMNTQQAVDVVLKPGRDLVDPDVALRIVQFVSSPGRAAIEIATQEPAGMLQVEPALLSVVLQELNNRRIRNGQDKISADLVGEGQAADILQQFYDRGLSGLSPQVSDFIVDWLLTASGARNRIAEEDALTKPGITPEIIALLIDRRIIQRQSSGSMKWLELTHDTLADVVRRSRTESRQRRALEAASAREEEIHRTLVRARQRTAIFATLLALALIALGYSAFLRHSLSKKKNQLQAETDELVEKERRLTSQERQITVALQTAGQQKKNLVQDAERETDDILQNFWNDLANQTPDAAVRVSQALKQLDSHAAQFPESITLQQRRVVGNALGAQIFYSAGLIREGFLMAQNAFNLAEGLPADGKGEDERSLSRATALYALGRGQAEQGHYDAATKLLQAVVASIAQRHAPFSDPRMAEIAALSLVSLGDVDLDRDANEAARAQYSKTLELVRSRRTPSSTIEAGFDPILRYCEVRSYQGIALSRFQEAAKAHYTDTKEPLSRALELLGAMESEDSSNLRWRIMHAEILAREGAILESDGANTDAFQRLREARPMAEEVFRSDESNLHSRYVLALIDRFLGSYYYASGDTDNAKLAYQRAIESTRDALSKDGSWVVPKRLYGLLFLDLSSAETGNQEKKEDVLKGRKVLESLAVEEKNNVVAFYNAADANLQLGVIQSSPDNAARDHEGAEASYNRASHWIAKIAPAQRAIPEAQDLEARVDIEEAYYLFRLRNERTQEENGYRQAIKIDQRLVSTAPSADRYESLALAYARMGDFHLAAGESNSAQDDYRRSLSVYDDGSAYLMKSAEIPGSFIAKKAEQQVFIASQWREKKEFGRAEASLLGAARTVHSSLQEDMMQPELLTAFQHVSKEADELRSALAEPVTGPAAIKRQKDLEQELDQTVREVDLIKQSLWPAGAKDLGDGAQLLSVETSQEWAVPPLIPGAWAQLAKDDEKAEKKKLSRLSSGSEWNEGDVLRVRKLPIAFYPNATLFEAEVRRRNGGVGVFDYLRSGDRTLVLDGSLDPIRKFEQSTVEDDGVSRKLLRLETFEQASQYLHFIPAALSEKRGGTFRIVDTAADLRYLPNASAADRLKLDRLVKPLRLHQSSDGQWAAEVTMQYTDQLSYVLLTINANTSSSTFDLRVDTAGATRQPLISEFFVDGVRILSDFPHDLTRLQDEVSRDEKAKSWADAEHTQKEVIDLITRTRALGSKERDREIRAERVELLKNIQLPRAIQQEKWADAMDTQAQIVDLAKGADDLSAKERDRTLLREEWKLLRIEAIKDSREKKWAEAVRAEKQMVELIPKVDTLSSADQARELSSAYLSLSWYSLFARDFAGALRAGDDGLKLTPSNNMLDTNRAHALLFLGRTQEAEALYRKHLGESIGDKSWGETILDDLNALSAAGLSSPEFPAIRAMMEKDKKPEKTAKGTP